jgi:hypothetical protein
MTQVYVSVSEENKFHTLITKKQINNYTYMVAIGYAGGGVFEEFYAKLNYDAEELLTGKCSRSVGSGEFETLIKSVKFNKNNKWFDVDIEDCYEWMDAKEGKIQKDLIDEVRKYIYFGYDEESGTEFEIPVIKSFDLTKFKTFENNIGKYHNDSWNEEFLELTNSDLWNLSTHFPHIIDLNL